MIDKQDVFDVLSSNLKSSKQEIYTLREYLKLCKNDKMAFANIAERILAAIGSPTKVDTSNDPLLSRIFQNKTIQVYTEFENFYGMESTIEQIVGFFKHAAQGLEEKKQILYLLGPVGGGKSSLAEKIKALAEKYPVYVLAFETPRGLEISPVFESPLGLFDPLVYSQNLLDEYGINKIHLTGIISPWAQKRLDEVDGDLTKVRVVKMYPSRFKQICVMKTEPGDENNQDISSLVGKVDIRKLEKFSQNDPDSYLFSGGLNRTTQGVLEFVEMFKAPIKMLNPLLTATQEGNYVGTESISAIPFQGLVLAHSNQSEWQQFRNNKNNEAFLDRVCVIKVPYCLRKDQEIKIYEKMISESNLSKSPCAPQTLNMLAEFSVLSRLKDHENSSQYTKMRVYNGDNVRDLDPHAKSIQEYRDVAGVDEGMDGTSTRFAFKILSKTFNFDADEVAADPVHLMYVLEQALINENLPEATQKKYINFIKQWLAPKYQEFIGKEIQKAYIEDSNTYGQNLFDRYVEFADHWIQNKDFKDPDTGLLMSRDALNMELEKIEKPAGIANPKDFRNEVVNFCLRARGRPENAGKNPKWSSYEKLREVIEKKMFTSMEELLPIITFGSKKDSDDHKKHEGFVNRLKEKGYTDKQIRRLVEWFSRVQKV